MVDPDLQPATPTAGPATAWVTIAVLAAETKNTDGETYERDRESWPLAEQNPATPPAAALTLFDLDVAFWPVKDGLGPPICTYPCRLHTGAHRRIGVHGL